MNQSWLYLAKTYNVHFLGIDNKQLIDRPLRRAIGAAIDKQAIVNSVLHDMGRIAAGPIPPGILGYQPPDITDSDLGVAKQELTASQYAGEPLTILVSNTPNSEQIGEIIYSRLSQIGLNVELHKVDLNTLISRIFSKERPHLFLAYSEWVFGAPELIATSFDSSKYPNPNVVGYSNSAVDELVFSLSSTSDRNRLNELCAEIERRAADDVPAVWLYHAATPILVKNRLSNIHIDGNNHWHLESAIVK